MISGVVSGIPSGDAFVMNAQASIVRPPASTFAAAPPGSLGFVRRVSTLDTCTIGRRVFVKELTPSFKGMRGSRSDSTSIPPASPPWSSWRRSSVVTTLAYSTPVPASQVKVGTGSPSPLGPSLVEKRPKLDGYSRLPARGTVNFALFSKHATAVTLCLFLSGKQGSPPDLEIALDPNSQRTGDIWHASVENVPLCGMLYAYKVDGPKGWGEGHRFDPSLLLIDPYAPLVDGRRKFGDGSQRMAQMYGTFDFESEPFDWGEAEAKRKPIPEKDVIIYEMNVRAYTADPSSGVEEGRRGSYSAVADKVQHLVQLGVNAVELLPIFEYDEMEFQRRPNPRDHMVNTWGYSTVNFFAPMSRFASNAGGPVAAAREVKEMVKKLHAVNTWGYSSVNFFAPMSRFASNTGGPVAAAREVKEMVKKLHAVNTWGYSSVNFFAPMSRFASNTGGPVAAAREVKEMVKKLHAMSSNEPLTRFNRLQPLSPSSTGEHVGLLSTSSPPCLTSPPTLGTTVPPSTAFNSSLLRSLFLPTPQVNTWGYSTVNFFAPMSRFASNGGGPVAAAREVKEMVKKLHAEGVEVILDVVYNHTNEADDTFPYTTSFRGIDNKTYYIVQPNSYVQLANYAGCGNTLNCNHPVVMQMILDSLRHWVQEYHVDGFRFDLASVLCRGTDGEPLKGPPHCSSPFFTAAHCSLLLPFAHPSLSLQEYHVDGFRFDLASVLCRGTDGEPLTAPPLIRAIAKDEVLSKCKLIAEPWDCGGLYQVGSFPNWDRWAEWNGKYRDDVRKFIKGDEGMKGPWAEWNGKYRDDVRKFIKGDEGMKGPLSCHWWAEWNGKYRDDVRKFIKGDEGMKGPFATRLAGSADMYHVNQRKPYHSINFVIAHDGFTLRDLVSYNVKHNEANGEEGRDGSNDNFSWNCGAEGATQDEGIIALRNRQMRNFHIALMVSQGTPMMLMGDEYGHTRNGNNNSYGHDTALNHFLWNQLDQARSSLFRFTAAVNRLRSWHPALGQANFLSPVIPQRPPNCNNWDNYESRFLAFSLHDTSGTCGDLYVAFNAHSFAVDAGLPPPPAGRQWVRLADTNLPSPRDIVDDLETIATNGRVISGTYNVAPYSSLILLATKAYEEMESEKRQCHLRCADRLQAMCFKNGGIYIKLGQHIAQLDYIVPEEYVIVMKESMLNTCPVTPYEDVRLVIQSELGKPPEEIFSSFDPTPVASASLAQVHRGTLKTGEDVAVKVQHAHLLDTAAADMVSVRLVISALYWFFPSLDYRWLITEVEESLPKELNFTLEASNGRHCMANFRSSPSKLLRESVAVPRSFPEFTGQRVLTMEWMEGVPLTDVARLKDMGINPADVAKLISTAFAEMIFRHGFVHCDPHAANVLVRPKQGGRRMPGGQLNQKSYCWITGYAASCPTPSASITLYHAICPTASFPLSPSYVEPEVVLLDHGLCRQLPDSFCLYHAISRYMSHCIVPTLAKLCGARGGTAGSRAMPPASRLPLPQLRTPLEGPCAGQSERQHAVQHCAGNGVETCVKNLAAATLSSLSLSLPYLSSLLSLRSLSPGYVEPEIVLLDHGMYRQLPDSLRLNYAHLWKALVLADARGIMQYSIALGAGADLYAIFAATLTLRSWENIVEASSDHLFIPDTAEEKKHLQKSAAAYFNDITRLLARLPRVLLLLLKTNDCLRSLDTALGTPPRGSGIMERYDVVVVGAGIMGSCAAYELAKRGRTVLLLEQFDLLHRRAYELVKCGR
ncbi:unnamed protein product [Closterium sp. NIES-64]|nr:unnamed protein product [Closterium sp. NIES-64]